MDYGNSTLLDSNDPLKRPNGGAVSVDVPTPAPEQTTPAKSVSAIACDIKHPLAAILANANAARRWLDGPDASLAEAITALDRITKDVARINAAVDAIRAMTVETGKASLT